MPSTGAVTPAVISRTVSAQESALFPTPRSSLIGPRKKENTTGFMLVPTMLIARADPTMVQP